MQLVSVPDEGVPRAGVTNVGEVNRLATVIARDSGPLLTMYSRSVPAAVEVRVRSLSLVSGMAEPPIASHRVYPVDPRQQHVQARVSLGFRLVLVSLVAHGFVDSSSVVCDSV